MRDLLSLSSSALPAHSRVLSLRATEALSRPYQIDVWIAPPSGSDADISDAVGGAATVTLDPDDGDAPFLFCGEIASVRTVVHRADHVVHHVVLVPRLRLLSQSRHSRVFTKMSLPDVLKAVLQGAGIPGSAVELRLTGTYSPEEHVTQYDESDLDFLQRWMELEGMYYFFEHEDGGEKLVITDDRSSHSPLRSGPVRYVPSFGKGGGHGEALSRFSCEHQALPAGVKLSDYDYTKPTLDVSARADVSRTGFNEVVVHNARFFDPSGAKRYAKIRAEEMLAQEVVFEASGAAFRLRAGALFELTDHPNPALEGKYLVTEARHAENQGDFSPDSIPKEEVYRVSVRAIRSDVQFRPRRTTAWPHVYGLEGGTIDGPAKSDYSQVDDMGRYAVKLTFDESDLKDGKASTWVRMAQPHGGSPEGFHFPLRKGTEVMFAFLGGDPDRPSIVGVAPNALTPSPVTRANHTTNVIQTGGRNRVEMEDQGSGQRVTSFTPTKNTYLRMGAPNDDVNANLSTEGNGKIEVGGGLCGDPSQLQVTTVGPKNEHVDKSVTEKYQGPFKTTVTNAVHEHYWKKKTETVHGALTEGFHSTRTTTVNKDVTETYNSQTSHVTRGTRELTVCDATTQTYTGPLTRNVTNPVTQTFGAQYLLDVTGDQTDKAASISRNIHLPIKQTVTVQAKNVCGSSYARFYLGGVTEIFVGLKSELLNGGLKAETALGVKTADTGLKVENKLAGIGNEPAHAEKGARTIFQGMVGKMVGGALIEKAITGAISAGGFLFFN